LIPHRGTAILRQWTYEEGSVKKLALFLLLFVVLTVIVSADDSNMYVRTVYIEKIYPTEFGYRVDYRRTNSLRMGAAYIPIEWFGRPDSPARLVYTDDSAAPFMNIYWLDNEFHHLVLVVQRHRSHVSWGSPISGEGLESRFDVDEPEILF
jgi:hypothetical protein